MAINCCILFNLPMLTLNSSVQSLTLKNVRSCYVLRSSFKLQNQLKNLNWTYVTRCFSLKGSFDIFISKVFISEMPLIPSINYACFTVKSCPKAILSYFEKSAQKLSSFRKKLNIFILLGEGGGRPKSGKFLFIFLTLSYINSSGLSHRYLYIVFPSWLL